EVEDDEACLAEPISCALNCLELSPVQQGDIVAIIGSGPLGVIFSDLVRWKGASEVVVVERSREQIVVASQACQADVFVNNSEENLRARIAEITGGRGVDVLIVAASSVEAQTAALHLVAPHGRVNLFAGLPRDNSTLCWDANFIHYKECAVCGTHGSRPEHVHAALQLMASGIIQAKRYISCTLPLAEIDRAIEAARGVGRLKIVKP
ncbi:MAG: zinc-binding dehydrogenase, partial [Chloroflexi bacterium]|nr:zinc-binding dehydrogenase [Chloroflexota bacterium]